MSCDRFREWKDPYLEGTLPPRRERKLDRHLVRCGACWEWFQQGDPVLGFSSLASPDRSEAFWRGWMPALREEIERRGRTPARPGRRPALAYWVAVPAGLLLVLIGGWLLFRTDRFPGGSPARVERPIGRAVPETVRPAGYPLPTLETTPSPDATVYTWHLEGRDEPPTEVILIFDESIDL